MSSWDWRGCTGARRELGLSRLAALYAAGTFVFSTWLSLHLHSGHLWVLGFVYVPWTVGLLRRSLTRHRWTDSVLAGLVVARFVILEGGGAHVLTLLAISTGVLACCWTLQQRSYRPIAAYVLMLACGVGLTGVKSVPAWQLLSANPRTIEVGGGVWSKFFKMSGSTGRLDAAKSLAADSTTSEKARRHDGRPGLPEEAATAGPVSPRSRWDMPRFAASMLLKRDRRSNTRDWPIQSWDWQEYGCYLGPLGVILLCLWLLSARQAWPWAVMAAFSFLAAAGNFAWFAPLDRDASIPGDGQHAHAQPVRHPVRIRRLHRRGLRTRCPPAVRQPPGRDETAGSPGRDGAPGCDLAGG